MAPTSSLKEKLSTAPVLGAFVTMSPRAVEIMAWRGYEMLCIDGEHAALGPTEVEDMVRAADACGIPAVVRVPAPIPAIAYALDAGAAGVLVPRIESAEQARECVALVRYPPVGVRGSGPGRASKYGQELALQAREANDKVVLAVQVETRPGVRAVEEIAAVEGVDVLFVGPGDLSVSLGCEWGSEEHTTTILTILKAGRSAGKLTGIFCRSADQMRPWLEQGARMFLLGGDHGLLGGAAAAAVTDARAVLAEFGNDAA